MACPVRPSRSRAAEKLHDRIDLRGQFFVSSFAFRLAIFRRVNARAPLS